MISASFSRSTLEGFAELLSQVQLSASNPDGTPNLDLVEQAEKLTLARDEVTAALNQEDTDGA